MTDVEYTVQIYQAVFGQDADIGDIYFQGVFNALASMSDRHQLALKCRFRENKTYAQVGEALGVSGSCARQIILLILLRMRKEKQKMCVSAIQDECDTLQKYIKKQKFAYRELYEQLSRLACGKDIDENLRERLEHHQVKIKDMGLSASITNALARADIADCEALLSANFDDLKKYAVSD